MSFQVGKIVFRSPLTTTPVPDPAGENTMIVTLKELVETQRQKIVTLERKILDLGIQNDEYRRSRVISPEEEETMRMQSLHVKNLQEQLDQLALWLRQNKSVQIAQGKHAGMSLVNCILMYLGGTIPDPLPPTTEGRTN
jgi:hypothetical protein